MSNYVDNATAEHLREMASEFARTCGSNVPLAAVTGALRTGAAEIDRLQQRLIEVLERLDIPSNYLP